VLQNGAEAGQITSAAYSPALKHVAALAYVRAASAAAGTQLEVLNRRANVTGSPR
jgi:glycine cleavage system aminomethyltransferase T